MAYSSSRNNPIHYEHWENDVQSKLRHCRTHSTHTIDLCSWFIIDSLLDYIKDCLQSTHAKHYLIIARLSVNYYDIPLYIWKIEYCRKISLLITLSVWISNKYAFSTLLLFWSDSFRIALKSYGHCFTIKQI